MIETILIVAVIIGAYVLGVMDGTGWAKESTSPFWRGYMDVRTWRIIWRRSPR